MGRLAWCSESGETLHEPSILTVWLLTTVLAFPPAEQQGVEFKFELDCKKAAAIVAFMYRDGPYYCIKVQRKVDNDL